MTAFACNCMYGPNDSRCCIAKAQRRVLEEAWRLGREGKPLPPEPEPPLFDSWRPYVAGEAI